MEVRVARIFNTFGPRMHPNDGRVVSNFIIQGIQGKDITIYGENRTKKTTTKKEENDMSTCFILVCGAVAYRRE